MRLVRSYAVLWLAVFPELLSAEDRKGDLPAVQPEGDRPAQSGDAGGDSVGISARMARIEKTLKNLEARARKGDRWTAKRRLASPFVVGGYPPGSWYPWYGLPQTTDEHAREQYGPSIEHTPRLGLESIYQSAGHMGILPPLDRDPLDVPPSLGQFEGVVGSAKAELAAAQKAAERKGGVARDVAPGTFVDPSEDEALKLMKSGKYREAGRIAAARFQETQSAYDALVLVEAFFGLGKFSTARAVLEAALETDGVVEALADDVASHFPSPEEFEMKLQDLESSGDYGLLNSYLKVHSKSWEAGLQALEDRSGEDKHSALLWKRYLAKALK